QLDEIDDLLLEDPQPDALASIHSLKKEIQYLRKICVPLREATHGLIRGDSELIMEETQLFLKDLLDHITHAVESLESARDTLTSMGEFYMSMVSLRMNQIMHVLTVMASIFIPLTFVTGIYGMNFTRIPELQWDYGYLYVWCLMLGMAGLILLFFKKQKWL
ncbi:MAG: hypothetical protein KDD62_05850, partial [Bdellovibrionales bacterium]|nr:hypothetical protein [Bdellovibrionales bacterium]